MLTPVLRWTYIILSLVVLGPLAASFTGAVGGPSGGHTPSMLLAASASQGLMAGAAAILVAVVWGLLGARLFGTDLGMTGAGLVLAWASWRMGTAEDAYRGVLGSGPGARLAIEAVGLGAIAVMLTLGLLRLGSAPKFPHPAHAPFGKADAGTGKKPKLSIGAMGTALGVGVVAGGVVAWLVVFEPLKGQAVVGAAAAGIAAAAAAFLASSASATGDGSDAKAAWLAPVGALAVLGVIGPIAGGVLAGDAGTGVGVGVAVVKGTLFPLANVLPWDWMAGAMLGTPVGVSWAKSMLEKKTHQAATA